MALIQTDPFSQVPVFIKLKFGTTELASGTAFFYIRNDSLFLISNWHNFSGRDSNTNKPNSNHGGIPDKVSCYLCLNGKYIEREWVDLPLNNNDEPSWYQHPTLGSAVDIGALPVILNEKFKAILMHDKWFTKMDLRISNDVFILGYPLGMFNKHGLPMWKRGSVASEPSTSEPSYLVDTATRPGMSGSPVIFRYRGFYKNNLQSDERNDDDWFGEGDMFAGIYSGRFGASDFEAQLGIVWKPYLIDEVIDGKIKAKPF